MLFVLDCSVAINWCLEDENNIYCDYTEPPAASGGTLPPAK